ncbi:hypothetical protein PCANC_12849 [Puccinia coronata f. sp. avenae]|uniref:Uncharacterized protein n=1 Tax=Puccinia coronata f. sp. avenae TaxID=200324 RepID=A0A2N5SPM7_9BASI|nr:hypothetical protein PCANC_12849 [Puccinia coronata f. sp. avenae]PLW24153.1 hypothetical protein PCASD_06688 [Puccinia coronata f. sp. avenae]
MLSRLSPRTISGWRRTFERASRQTANYSQTSSLSSSGDRTTTTIPRWLKDLEKKQAALLPPSSPSPRSTPVNNRQRELDDQIIIYEAHIRDDFSGSPNRIALSMVGLLITSGLVANQIRHHGAGPVWPDPKSAWLDFELKLWDQSTRFLVSMGLISFSFFKSLKFLFTLSHTVKRITIQKSHLNQLKQLLSSKRNKPALMASVPLNFYSVGSLDLIYPINKLFRFSILDAIRLSDLLRLSRPITAQSQPHNQRSLWLKFAVSPNRSLQTPPAPKQIFDHNQLNSFALQIPAVGVWGNSKFDLSASDILSLFEEKVQSVDGLTGRNSTPDSRSQSDTGGSGEHIPVEDEQRAHTLFGLDFRHSLALNLAVLKARLSTSK